VTRSKFFRAGLIALAVVLSLLWRGDAVTAQDRFEPLVLTEDQTTRYVNVLPEKAKIYSEMEGKLLPELQAALAVVAKEHGFTEFEKFWVMSNTIAVVMSGIDPQTKAFTEPAVVLEQKIQSLTKIIADMKNDMMSSPGAPDPESVDAQLLPLQQLLDDLKDGRGSLPEKTDPENVRLIQKYFVKLVSGALPRRVDQ